LFESFKNLTLCTIVVKDEILFVKNIDGFDGPLACEDVATNN
jgi:hypothetical protein